MLNTNIIITLIINIIRKMKDLFSPIKILKNQEPGEIQFLEKVLLSAQ